MAGVPLARHLVRAKDLVDAHYADDLDVAALARAAGLSRAHFSRLFRATFGRVRTLPAHPPAGACRRTPARDRPQRWPTSARPSG